MFERAQFRKHLKIELEKRMEEEKQKFCFVFSLLRANKITKFLLSEPKQSFGVPAPRVHTPIVFSARARDVHTSRSVIALA